MTNIAKKSSLYCGKKFLQQAFHKEQGMLMHALELSEVSITHDGKRGEVDEKHFIDILKKYLPDRYAVDSAIIIDSKGQTSDQIDVVIYDHQYTPTLLDQKCHKYVPAEAVYGIFEVKPIINKTYLIYTAEKANSVRSLYRTSTPIAHAGGTYPAKEHFTIISGIIAVRIGWIDGFGNAFKKIHKSLNKNWNIDCGLAVSGYCFDIFNGSDLYTIGPKKNSLVFFLFRLLKKLQSLGTVPAIDWNTYAKQLSKGG